MENEQNLKFMHDLLSVMISKRASDMFLTVGFPPAIKVDGKLTPISPTKLNAEHTIGLVRSIMNDRQAEEFKRTSESNFAINPTDIGRFRINAFIQQGYVAAVLRTIPTEVPTFEKFPGLPPVLKDLALTKRGLIVFVGGTGTGKTTTLAALLNHRNENSYGHIITIEDPIEFVHPHKNCVVSQREVGVDTESWEAALENALRQAQWFWCDA